MASSSQLINSDDGPSISENMNGIGGYASFSNESKKVLDDGRSKSINVLRERNGGIKASTDITAEGKADDDYGSLSKKEKIKLILKQMRSSLAKEANIRPHTVCNKTNTLDMKGTKSYKALFFEFMAEYHSNERNIYKLSKDYHTAYSTQIRMMATAGSEEGGNTRNEEAKENHDTHREERWMSSLRASVLFLALSPHTPEQNETLHRVSMDNNLEKIEVCYDIVHTLLQKRPMQNILSHQSTMQLLDPPDAFKSVATTVPQAAYIGNETTGRDDYKCHPYSCIRSGVLAGGTIARIGRSFTTSVLGVQEPTPLLELSIRNNRDDDLIIIPDGGEYSDGLGFTESATLELSHGLTPPQAENTPQNDEQRKYGKKQQVTNGSNGKKQSNKTQIFIQKNSFMRGIAQRLRHYSLSYIPNDGTRIIGLLALQTYYNSSHPASSQNQIKIGLSDHDNPKQTESSRIIEYSNQNLKEKVSKHNLRHIQAPCTHSMRVHHDEESSIPQSPSLASSSSDTAIMPMRSPQQSLWLENAIQYENKGNYASALYYYELCLNQLRDIIKKWNGQNYQDELKYTNENHMIPLSHVVEMTWLLHKVGVVRWKTGDYVGGLTPLLEATSSFRCLYLNSSLGSDSKDVYGVGLVEILNSMAKIYLSMGKFQQARTFFEESYDILNNLYAESFSNATEVRNGAGQEEYEIMERRSKLEGIRKKANETASAIIMHPSMARTIIAIGMIDDMQGNHSLALQKLRNGYNIQRKILCPDDIEIAATLNAIGSTNGKMGNYSRSMKYHKRALKIYIHQLGKDHVDVAVTRNNIGEMYHSLGNLKKSLEAFTESLRVMKITLPITHRNIAAAQHNIALIHLARGEHDKALLLFKDVLKSQRRSLGDTHIDVALTLESIGDAYEHKGRLDRGIKLYQKALRIRRNTYGKSHLYVAFTLDRIGKSLMIHGKDLKEAMRRFHEALNLYYHNGLTNDDENIILARANLQKIRNNLKLDTVRGEFTSCLNS